MVGGSWETEISINLEGCLRETSDHDRLFNCNDDSDDSSSSFTLSTLFFYYFAKLVINHSTIILFQFHIVVISHY